MPTVSPAPSKLPPVPAQPSSGSAMAAEAGSRFSDAFDAALQAQPGHGAQGMRPPTGSGGTEKAAAKAPDAPPSAGGTRAPEDANSVDETHDEVDPTKAAGDEESDPALPPWLPWVHSAPAADSAPDGRMETDLASQSRAAEAVTTDSKGAGGTAVRARDDAAGTERGAALTDSAERSALQAASARAGDAAGASGPGSSQGKAAPRTDDAIGQPGFGPALAAADNTAGAGTQAAAAAAATSQTALAGLAGTPPGATDGPARQVAAHVQSPAFGAALGAQLNLMVREGVTEARLHLNPAEMGPISVQIRVVGQQARVEMVAEQAATRQALEQAMPALAGALRDSGLTLSGGGVFDQRDPRQDAPDDSGRRPARDGQAAGDAQGLSESAMIAARGRPAATPRGVVDLYA